MAARHPQAVPAARLRVQVAERTAKISSGGTSARHSGRARLRYFRIWVWTAERCADDPSPFVLLMRLFRVSIWRIRVPFSPSGARIHRLLFSGLTLAIGLTLVSPWLQASARSDDAATPADQATPGARPSIGTPIISVPNDGMSLSANISALLDGQQGIYGVVVVDPAQGALFEQNATIPFISASLYKLPLLAHIYGMIEAGQVTLDQQLTLEDWYYSINEGGDGYFDEGQIGGTTTVQEALFATGAYSSNVGALALASLTDWPAIQETARQLGMVDTSLMVYPAALPEWPPAQATEDAAGDLASALAFIDAEASYGPVMVTTPADIATFFERLIAGEVVSQPASTAISDILAQQMVDDRIPALLPTETKTVHKTGNLDQVIHDAGIIYTPRGPVILAALIQGDPDDSQATGVIQQLARLVFDLAPLTGA